MITVKADQYRRVTLHGIKSDPTTIELAAYWEECGPAPDVILPRD